MFILEALQAEFGDSLLLHYGTSSAPKYILIDGGPDGVYETTLQKRLEQLRKKSGGQLKLEMVMVSHIDRDHITGVLAMVDELVDLKQSGQMLPYKIIRLWHNSFDDFIKKPAGPLAATFDSALSAASVGGATGFGLMLREEDAAVVADVKQGRELRNQSALLSLKPNAPFSDIVIAPAKGKKIINIGNGLKFTVIAPNQRRIDDLQKEWDEKLEKLKLAKKKEANAIVAAYLDKSIANLSSIVVIAESDGKTALLTGDARGDDIIASVKAAGILKGDSMHVDLLKLPHHGSDRNVSTKFFQTITADHYVVSANGKNTNPDISTLKMISEARGMDRFTIYITNRENRLDDFFIDEKKKGKKYKVVFRSASAPSVQVKLAP